MVEEFGVWKNSSAANSGVQDIMRTAQPRHREDIFKPPSRTFDESLQAGTDFAGNLKRVDLIHTLKQLPERAYEEVSRCERVAGLRHIRERIVREARATDGHVCEDEELGYQGNVQANDVKCHRAHLRRTPPR